MADNVAVTAGAGTTIATDDRGAVGHVQRVVDQGGSVIASGRASVTTTSGSALAANTTRKYVIFYNLGSDVVDIGPSGVASGSGFPLYPGESVTLYTTAAIHMDAASGTQSVAYIEVSD